MTDAHQDHSYLIGGGLVMTFALYAGAVDSLYFGAAAMLGAIVLHLDYTADRH